MATLEGPFDAGGKTYMKPMTAITLMMEKMNSASPYARTPKKLILIIKVRKTATQAAGEMGEFQYLTVIAAATTSSGRAISHCKQ